MSTHSEMTHGSHNQAAADHDAHVEHGGPKVYTAVLVALLILTGLTVGAAYIDLGAGNVVVALLIATIKASLVALFFMHLKWEKPVNSIIAVAGFIFLGIFLMFDLIDATSRNYYLPQNVHRTEIPLTPGTAPLPLTEILPDNTPGAAPTGASPVPGAEPTSPVPSGTTPAAGMAPAVEKK